MAGIRERKYKLKNGSTKTYYEISWYYNDKQYKKGGFKSKIDAQLALNKYITSAMNKNIKFFELVDDYLNRHCELNCKPTTKVLYKNYLDVNLQSIKNVPIKEIKKRNIESLVLELKNKNLNNKTINDIISFVKSVLNYGVDSEFLQINPCQKIKKLTQIKPNINFLNEIQMEIFLKLAKNLPPVYYALFSTAVFSGMRRGELLGLEWSDIDFSKSKIRINKQIYKGVKQATKTNKERTIDIPDNLVKIIFSPINTEMQ